MYIFLKSRLNFCLFLFTSSSFFKTGVVFFVVFSDTFMLINVKFKAFLEGDILNNENLEAFDVSTRLIFDRLINGVA